MGKYRSHLRSLGKCLCLLALEGLEEHWHLVLKTEERGFSFLTLILPEKGAILANATPLGMHPNTDRIPVAKGTLGDYKVVFDAVYMPRKTTLLKEAEAARAIIVSGVEMFLRQAIEQFNLFTGRKGTFNFFPF
ncbi:bifunctional 3-dehydroquinate dehydratase/shikimate dehydrogenase, chloroplastic-like [Camellia sinensis]|uniref:bifunctional 3-dehydroquinate dehydratase/shikimate dehydrogenase, chloroplastic-like n=1 Tax=Camellia sinensis TaxID=4442 RepID=UPI001036B095|nr:bifunctional 3-dehydroquinate dehydratase/shikimate dehydrogenase, chloroplastic-like [Camellia sinensis]